MSIQIGAVSPARRCTGIAGSMYADLNDYFRQMKVAEFKIVVAQKLAHAHKFYRRMGAKPMAELELHQGANSVVYVQAVM